VSAPLGGNTRGPGIATPKTAWQRSPPSIERADSPDAATVSGEDIDLIVGQRRTPKLSLELSLRHCDVSGRHDRREPLT